MTMNCPNPPNRYNPADEPLWLVVQRDDRTNCFEFPPHTHKAIVVGSCSNSDVRISGAAPVAFFLEREGTSIWLTPAYADAELRLDTLKVDGKRRIYTHGLVELANIELRLRVRDTPPTLRGDGLVRIDSEVSDPMSKRAAAAVDDLTATTTIDSSTVIAALRQGATTTMPPASSIPEMALATKTIEVDAFNFDGWFDDAIKEGSSAKVDTQPIEPVIPASTSTSAPAATMPKFARPPRPRVGPLNVKTEKMAPIQWPPESAGIVEAPSTPRVLVAAPDASTPKSSEAGTHSPRETPSSAVGEQASIKPLSAAAIVPVESTPRTVNAEVAKSSNAGPPATSKSEPKIDPYRTIEIAPIRFSEPTPQSATSRSKLETLRQTTTIQLSCGGTASETTDFDVPVVKPTPAPPVTNATNSAAANSSNLLERQDRRPIVIKTPTPAQNASIGSDPWFQEHGSDRPVSTSSAAKVGRRLPSPSVALERLGLRAKRQPVLVFGGAAIGSLVLVLFFAGAAKILNQHSGEKSERAMAARTAIAGTGTHSESSNATTGEPANETTFPPSGAAQPPVPAEAKPEDVPAALAAIPDVNPAVGHLFAGRLPEAEQAYRDLATKFPGEPVFQSASRILARKNGPNCRGANSSKTACPSVKP